MATSPAQYLDQIAAVTARDRLLIARHRGEGARMEEIGDKVTALSDAARALEAVRASYALIGGVAVGIHSGAPRATADVDIAVHTAADRSVVSRSLTTFGFRLIGEFAHSLNFRHASGEPVQLAFDPVFDSMIERADRFTLGAVSVALVQKADLIVMKERAAADPGRRKSKRLRDQADVELLRGDVPEPDEGW
jgi:hypothetical protein